MSERRFTEDEVAEILKHAAEAQESGKSLAPAQNGLTLTELTEIGREVGISPQAMQVAAQRVNRADRSSQKYLGLPIGVGRIVELDRKLSEEEWDRIVADLRETFNARGVVEQEGSIRTWRNGNLEALLEPTESGQRLRMRTMKGNAVPYLNGGIGVATLGVAMYAIGAAIGVLGEREILLSGGMLIAAGVLLFGAGGLNLPGWANRRRRQMDEIAERLLR